MIELDKENILINVEANDYKEVIHTIVNRMAENGYVDKVYAEHVIKRENEYPTGLPTEGVITALPHAFSDNVSKTGFGVATLSCPVEFKNMGDPDESLNAEIVFLIANKKDCCGHLENLQELMECFSNEELLLRLKNASTSEEFLELFQKGLEEEN